MLSTQWLDAPNWLVTSGPEEATSRSLTIAHHPTLKVFAVYHGHRLVSSIPNPFVLDDNSALTKWSPCRRFVAIDMSGKERLIGIDLCLGAAYDLPLITHVWCWCSIQGVTLLAMLVNDDDHGNSGHINGGHSSDDHSDESHSNVDDASGYGVRLFHRTHLVAIVKLPRLSDMVHGMGLAIESSTIRVDDKKFVVDWPTENGMAGVIEKWDLLTDEQAWSHVQHRHQAMVERFHALAIPSIGPEDVLGSVDGAKPIVSATSFKAALDDWMHVCGPYGRIPSLSNLSAQLGHWARIWDDVALVNEWLQARSDDRYLLFVTRSWSLAQAFQGLSLAQSVSCPLLKLEPMDLTLRLRAHLI